MRENNNVNFKNRQYESFIVQEMLVGIQLSLRLKGPEHCKIFFFCECSTHFVPFSKYHGLFAVKRPLKTALNRISIVKLWCFETNVNENLYDVLFTQNSK